MSLSASTLALAIAAAWRGKDGNGLVDPSNDIADDAIAALTEAIAEAVVAHITSTAVVTGTAIDPISGVLPVTGTIS